MPDITHPALLLITGHRGIGKSTVCLRLAEYLQREKAAGGIVTLAVGPHRHALDLTTRERRLLAVRGETLTGPRWGDFSFSQETLNWGNDVVIQAAASTADLVLLDEVGPLELIAGEGFLPALRAILDRTKAGLVVVRPDLLDQVKDMAGSRSVATWEVTRENRDELPAQIVSQLLSASSD